MSEIRDMSAADKGWREIERAAEEQARVELAERESTPLLFGDYIAWANCLYGRTDGISPVHRVGIPKKDAPYTTCGEPIPHPVRWLPLSGAMVRAMAPCRFCEAEYIRVARENAA